jgi:hypothetical protein
VLFWVDRVHAGAARLQIRRYRRRLQPMERNTPTKRPTRARIFASAIPPGGITTAVRYGPSHRVEFLGRPTHEKPGI